MRFRWSLIVLVDRCPIYPLSGAVQVSVILQLVYITKFFHWEMGYMNSMDIQHDRAGYYLCWGCLVRPRRRLVSLVFPSVVGCVRGKCLLRKGHGLMSHGYLGGHPALAPCDAFTPGLTWQVWVPGIYASPGCYLVNHPIDLGLYGSAAILFLGVLSIYTNYDADRQRHAFRQVWCGKQHHEACFTCCRD